MTLRNGSFARPARFVLAAMVVTVTVAVLAHAADYFNPLSRISVAYKLAPGANSANITPVANTPVMILADQTGTVCGCDNVGSSLTTVVNSTVDSELVWNGFESDGDGFASGFSAVAGTHIMFIDFDRHVDLQVSNGTSFHVHNAGSSTYNGNVTLIW